MEFTQTHLIILVTAVVWLGWTILARKYHNPTISMSLMGMMWNCTTVSLIWGILLGHWAGTSWGDFRPIDPISYSFVFALPFTVPTLVFDIVWLVKKGANVRHGSRWPIWYYILGLPVGLLFWAQD